MSKYVYKRKPYKHQVKALKKLLSNGWGGALMMDPRTGKTQVAIDFASVRHQQGEVNRVLILCPLGVMGVWEDEIAAVCPHPHSVLVWDRDSRKTQELPKFGKDRLDFVILNHDALSTPPAPKRGRDGKAMRDEHGNLVRAKRKGGKYEMRRKIKAWAPQLLVVDESHRFKSPSAAKTRSLYAIVGGQRVAGGEQPVLVPYRINASGTMVTKQKRILDIYAQWRILNPQGWIKHHTADSFKNQYGKWTTRNGYPQWLGNNDREIAGLRLKIHKDAFAITRDECYDLPPSRDQIIPVTLTGHTAEIYDEMVEQMIAQIKSGELTEAQIKLVLRLRLAQITSGMVKTSPSPSHPKGRLVRIGRDKLAVLESRLTDLYEAGEKVVIAARFRGDLASILALHKRMRVDTFEAYGGVSRLDRDWARRQFKEREGPVAFVMQPSASSMGIDLSTSATMIWYSLIDSYVDFAQAKDRIALSPRGTVHEFLLARGTVDYDMLQTLKEDADFVKMVQRAPDRLRRR